MAIPIGDGYGSLGPLGEATTLTTNSTTTLNPWSRAVYVATTGDVVVTFGWTTASITISSVQPGTLLPVRVQQVHSCPAGTLALW